MNKSQPKEPQDSSIMYESQPKEPQDSMYESQPKEPQGSKIYEPQPDEPQDSKMDESQPEEPQDSKMDEPQPEEPQDSKMDEPQPEEPQDSKMYEPQPEESQYPLPPLITESLWDIMPEEEKEDWRHQQVEEYLKEKEDYLARLVGFHRAKLHWAKEKGDPQGILINQAALEEATHGLENAEKCHHDWRKMRENANK